MTGATYYWCSAQYGNLKLDQAKLLERESGRLRSG